MPGRFTLDLGGIHLNVESDVPVVDDSGDAAYSGFRSGPSAGGERGFDVALTIDDPRPPCSARKVWEAGDAWSLYREGAKRIVSGPSRFRGWRADIDEGRVTVRCGQAFVRQEQGTTCAVNPIRYPLDQLLMIYALARRRGVILHACGADFNGKGALFLGQSGAGKSTIARLLASAGGCTVLSDDRVIVRILESGPVMYGTPWPGEAGMAVNRSVPLKACFVLAKAGANRLEAMSPGAAAESLLPVASVPWYEEEAAGSVLDTCGALVAAVPMWKMHFRKDPGAARMVMEAMA